MSRVRRHERSSSVPESQQRFLTGVSKSYPTSKLFYAAWPFPERRMSSFANQAASRVRLIPDGSEGVERTGALRKRGELLSTHGGPHRLDSSDSFSRRVILVFPIAMCGADSVAFGQSFHFFAARCSCQFSFSDAMGAQKAARAKHGPPKVKREPVPKDKPKKNATSAPNPS